MKNETFVNQFNETVAFINENNTAVAMKKDKRVLNAFNDISAALSLTYQAVALLVWSLSHMNGEMVDLCDIAAQIDYSEQTVSSSLDELEQHRYMVKVDGDSGCLDVTENTKALLINHYCFYKLLNS